MLKNLIEWLTLGDYYKAKEDAAVEVVSRFARGNVNAQDGGIIDESALDKLIEDGDKAMLRVQRVIPA